MGAKLDLEAGMRFGKWTVLSEAPRTDGRRRWLCRCDCGTQKPVLASNLTTAQSVSCGCGALVVVAQRTYHGQSSRTAAHLAEYNIWNGMHRRCSNPKAANYDRYGAKGVTVCERWRDFEAFLADMGPRPSRRHTIERRENSVGYVPSNCRWATWTEQARNRKNNLVFTFRGVTAPLSQLCEQFATDKYHTVYGRIRRGVPIERALR